MHFELRLEGVYEGGAKAGDRIEREKKVDLHERLRGGIY